MLAERVKEWNEESLERGVQQGIQKGAAQVLIRQLERKFGELTSESLQRLEDATEEPILQWSENILSARTLADVFGLLTGDYIHPQILAQVSPASPLVPKLQLGNAHREAQASSTHRTTVKPDKSRLRSQAEAYPPFKDLTEVKNMLAERLKEWNPEALKKGVQQGIQKGAAQVLIRQLERKFGELPSESLLRLEGATEEQILQWSENILSARTLGDVFGH